MAIVPPVSVFLRGQLPGWSDIVKPHDIFQIAVASCQVGMASLGRMIFLRVLWPVARLEWHP